jgi:Transmembrane secretion effector
MQLMATAWLMVELTGSSFLAALVQTAVFLPMFLFSLPAGQQTAEGAVAQCGAHAGRWRGSRGRVRRGRHKMSRARKSLTLVKVGPVTTRSDRRWKKL